MTVGNEIVYRVAKTPSGVKVSKLDGRGLIDGVFVKGDPVYFYGDDAEEKAHAYAENRAEDILGTEVNGDAAVRVVELGKRL